MVSVPWSSATVQGVCPLVLSCGRRCQSPGPAAMVQGVCSLCCGTHEALSRLLVSLQMVSSPSLCGSLERLPHPWETCAVPSLRPQPSPDAFVSQIGTRCGAEGGAGSAGAFSGTTAPGGLQEKGEAQVRGVRCSSRPGSTSHL